MPHFALTLCIQKNIAYSVQIYCLAVLSRFFVANRLGMMSTVEFHGSFICKMTRHLRDVIYINAIDFKHWSSRLCFRPPAAKRSVIWRENKASSKE